MQFPARYTSLFVAAENVAERWSLSREEQDQFACESQRKAGIALKENHFQKEIVPVTIKGRKGDTVVAKDEYPKPDTTVEGLGKLRTAFKPVSYFFSLSEPPRKSACHFPYFF